MPPSSPAHAPLAGTMPARTTRSDVAPARTRPAAPLVACATLLGLLGSLLVAAPSAQATTARHARTLWEIRTTVAVERLLNDERRACHRSAVRMRTSLLVAARRHDITMAHYDTMSHQLSSEYPLGRRVSRAGYRWSMVGENIGWNSRTTAAGVLALQQTMFAEKAPNNGHRLNILNLAYTNMGIDVYRDSVHHKVWLTVDFGRP